jgi:tetratricopeptide (TPR) repeat protein
VGRGIEASQEGRDEEAEKLFSQAMEMCPVDERCRRHYAETLWRQGRGTEAVAQMHEAVRLSGGDPHLLVRLGEMHLALDDSSNALRESDLAIARRENLASAWALRGDIFYRQGDLREALACYHRALRYEPHNPPVQIAVAGIHRDLGQPQRCLAVLDAAVDQFSPGPAPPAVLAHHGLALKALGRYEEAVESLTAAADGSGDLEIVYQLAETRLLAGDASGASLAVRRVLQVNPYHPAALRLETALREYQPVAVTLKR